MVVREHAFDIKHLTSYEELSNMLEKRMWTRLNSLVKEINQSIRFNFYANAANQASDSYSSYVRGKIIDYSPLAINYLLCLRALPSCSIQTRMGDSCV